MFPYSFVTVPHRRGGFEGIVATDETWINLYVPETKPAKARVPPKAAAKFMFIFFLDWQSMLLVHPVLYCQTVNAKYYYKVSIALFSSTQFY